MKHKNPAQKEHIIYALLASYKQIGLILIFLIAIAKSCFTPEPNPLDNDIIRVRQLLTVIKVVDSTHNGFRIIYATEDAVTKARLKEIRSRAHIADGFKRLKRDAPAHFEELLTTDIYGFADFAIKYDMDPAVRIDKIFIYGKEKCEMYLGPNPQIKNSARWINSETEQGIQYINKSDIYYRRRDGKKVYRYWRCFGMNSTSSTDERFSHFSEDERLW